ncbi:MAG: DNA primase [Bacteroidales bacterium]|nr:DNA primase [Bacteroidales bacterium]
MKKIDRETVQRILDAADIVEVVSDFVSLKKRGANYIGLCPFHNERTPSFSVSRAKGICKCFSCGKGGSPVNFIMAHEQMTYYEALRYLAKKYNIEIREHELTDAEKQQATERESLMAVNDFALEHFETNMSSTQDGRDIGLAYFRERGINDLMIKRFRLGYALDKSDALYRAAIAKGYNEQYLIATGLCSRSERGQVYDRFRGRVIYPIFSVSGRVVAFGGRTLRTDKTMAKYVNSPESAIYCKSYELYGLYQAKGSIVKHDKCILVEGYMDVISMHQIGVDNVVASSGTSLTEGQVRLIHRFTQNVTLIYDADPAGIKASLRGIDLLLAEGLNIKVLLLPEGEDPDSFAQSHSLTQVEEYIKQNEVDFIRFKTRILLSDAGGDPIQRSRVITDIVKSIAVIPDAVTRAVYLKECSRMLEIEEKVLALQLDKTIADNLDRQQRQPKPRPEDVPAEQQPAQPVATFQGQPVAPAPTPAPGSVRLRRYELTLMKYIVKYGYVPIAQELNEEGEETGQQVTVIEFIDSELRMDDIVWTDPVCARMMEDAWHIFQEDWPMALATHTAQLQQERAQFIKAGEEDIRLHGRDLSDIQNREKSLIERADRQYQDSLAQFTMRYLEDYFLSAPDDEVRNLSTALASEKYQLSKVHTKYAHVETEYERLRELVERGVLELKYAILDEQIAELNQEARAAAGNRERVNELMTQVFELYQLKSQFAKILGDRIVNPK